jgi:glycosyltransferase involved in cell wall biosynthesis
VASRTDPLVAARYFQERCWSEFWKVFVRIQKLAIIEGHMDAHVPLVAFNAHLLAGDASYRSAGISVYIESLLRELSGADYGIRLQVLLGKDAGPLVPPVQLAALRAQWPTRHAWQRVLWEQTVLPARLRYMGAHLLHAPAFVGPLAASCPAVITVHDLSFLRYPQFFRRGNRLYLRTLTGVACRRAAAVIAVSNFTAREVHRLLGVPESRIFTVYHGVAQRFRRLPEGEVARFRRDRGLPERFILFFGTLEPRKNLIRLVRAFAQLRDPDLHLVLAGAKGWFYEAVFAEVERLELGARVHFTGYVPAEDQAFWYNAAHAFAYVSIYEGFGMPVLEALACGTPTVTSTTTSLPEAGGSAVMLVAPEDETALADALHVVLNDAAARDAMREAGLRHAAGFSWATAARQTVEVYHGVLARSGKTLQRSPSLEADSNASVIETR